MTGRRPQVVAVSLCLLGIALMLALAPLGALTAGPWRRFAWICGAVAGGAAAIALGMPGLLPGVRRFAVGVATLAAALAIGAGSDTAANRPDAAVLPVGFAAIALGATGIFLALTRWARFAKGPAAAVAGAFLMFAAYQWATRLDPVIVGLSGSAQPRLGPFYALAAGAAGGWSLTFSPSRSLRGAILAAVLLVAFWGASLYGVALAGLGLAVAAEHR